MPKTTTLEPAAAPTDDPIIAAQRDALERSMQQRRMRRLAAEVGALLSRGVHAPPAEIHFTPQPEETPLAARLRLCDLLVGALRVTRAH